jgi:hypothetical protein
MRDRIMAENTIAIENASWWMAHSQVVVKEDYLATDEAWVNDQLIAIGVKGQGAKATPDMRMTGKDRSTLIAQRMVCPGSVVAVRRRSGRVHTVQLPQEADQLLYVDLIYIIQQIEYLNAPMTAEELAAFLPSAKESSKAS